MRYFLASLVLIFSIQNSADAACPSGKKGIRDLAMKAFGTNQKLSMDEFVMPEEKILRLRNESSCVSGECHYLFLYQTKNGCLKEAGSFKGMVKFIGDDWNRIEVIQGTKIKSFRLDSNNLYISAD